MNVYMKAMRLPFLTGSLIPVVLYGVLAGKGSWLYLAVLLTMPLALKAIRVLNIHYQTYDEIIPAQALTIQTHLALGVVMSVALVAHKLVF